MNMDLLECKGKATLLVASEDAPRNDKGRAKGYISRYERALGEAGYAELNLTSQNLRDKVASLEKTMGSLMETITSSVGQRDQELQESERNQDSEKRENIIESEEIMNTCISTPSEVYQNID